MSHPFGGHPTFGAYIGWARKHHKLSAQTGYAADGAGKVHTTTKLSIEDGESVVVPGIDQNERLTPSMVGYLDRRLGIVSPYFSVNDDELED